jgi:hypothetical protein
MMDQYLNQEDAHTFLTFLVHSAMKTFDELGYESAAKDKFIDLFHKKIREEAEKQQKRNESET